MRAAASGFPIGAHLLYTHKYNRGEFLQLQIWEVEVVQTANILSAAIRDLDLLRCQECGDMEHLLTPSLRDNQT